MIARRQIIAYLFCVLCIGCSEIEPSLKIYVDKDKLDMTIGDRVALNVTAENGKINTDEISWYSSNEKVAKVSPMGEVTAIAEGRAIIKVVSGTACATCVVTVLPLAEDIIFNKTSIEIERTGTYKMEYILLPDGAGNSGIVWKSSDSDVVTVDNGIITGVGVGEAKVTASIGDNTAECKVKVNPKGVMSVVLNKSEAQLVRGSSITLVATIEPDDADCENVIWQSDDECVAKVSEDGTVSAMATGTALITAEACGKTAACRIIVTGNPRVGDYYYSDGTYGTEPNPQKEILGVVFYTGNPSVDDKFLQKEHPNCTHGLVMSLKNDQRAYVDLVGLRKLMKLGMTFSEWIAENSEYTTVHTTTEDGKMQSMIGYGTSKALLDFNAAPENAEWKMEMAVGLEYFQKNNPLPEFTSGWYMPSVQELVYMCTGDSHGRPEWDPLTNKLILSKKLRAIGADDFGYMYGSTLELDLENYLLLGFNTGGYFFDNKTTGRYNRYIFAF